MNKSLVGTLLLVLVLVLPVAAMAGVNVDISISLPPLIEFTAPPMMVVIPGTYVYAVTDRCAPATAPTTATTTG